LDAQALVGELVAPGSVFAFLAEHRHEVFPDSFIADLFSSSTGRPSLPADLIGSVLMLKELDDLSDPQTAEALRFDIRWKVAGGRPRWCIGASGSRPLIVRIGCSMRWRR